MSHETFKIEFKRAYYDICDEHELAQDKFAQDKEKAIGSMISRLEDFAQNHKMGEWVAERTTVENQGKTQVTNRMGRYYENQGSPTLFYVLHENTRWETCDRLVTHNNYADTIFAFKLLGKEGDEWVLNIFKKKLEAGKAGLSFDNTEMGGQFMPCEFSVFQNYVDDKRSYGICGLTFNDDKLAENKLSSFPQLTEVVKRLVELEGMKK